MKKETYKREEQEQVNKDIETTPQEDLWGDFYEDSRDALGKAMELISHGFASVEINTDSQGLESAIVTKKSNGSIIYQTTVPSEVETLRSLKF